MIFPVVIRKDLKGRVSDKKKNIEIVIEVFTATQTLLQTLDYV